MRNYLQAVHAYHVAQFNWTYYEQEFNAMHWECPRLESRWNNTVRVIILRHPIERHLSEYFYSGVTKGFNATQRKTLSRMCKDSQYPPSFYELLEQLMIPWVTSGEAKMRQTNKFFRFFSHEMQVRALSGETTELPYTEKPKICDNKKRRRRLDACKCWDNPCSYGGGWLHGGTDVSHEVNQVALDRAKTNLALFDLVLLTETMDDPYQVEYAAAVLDVPTTNVSLSEKKENAVDASGKSAMLVGLKEQAPKLLAILQERSKWELQLYEYAQQLNRERVLRWKATHNNHLIAD